MTSSTKQITHVLANMANANTNPKSAVPQVRILAGFSSAEEAQTHLQESLRKSNCKTTEYSTYILALGQDHLVPYEESEYLDHDLKENTIEMVLEAYDEHIEAQKQHFQQTIEDRKSGKDQVGEDIVKRKFDELTPTQQEEVIKLQAEIEESGDKTLKEPVKEPVEIQAEEPAEEPVKEPVESPANKPESQKAEAFDQTRRIIRPENRPKNEAVLMYYCNDYSSEASAVDEESDLGNEEADQDVDDENVDDEDNIVRPVFKIIGFGDADELFKALEESSIREDYPKFNFDIVSTCEWIPLVELGAGAKIERVYDGMDLGGLGEYIKKSRAREEEAYMDGFRKTNRPKRTLPKKKGKKAVNKKGANPASVEDIMSSMDKLVVLPSENRDTIAGAHQSNEVEEEEFKSNECI